MRSTGRQAASCLLALLLLPWGTALAQPRALPLPRAQAKLDGFSRELQAIDRLLVEGESRAAYTRAETVGREMMHSFISGPAIETYLGTVATLRAIAAVQLGQAEEALWYWHVACQLFPAVAGYQMTAYGDAGPFLKEHPPRAREHEGEEAAIAVEQSRERGEVKRPRKQRGWNPEFPWGQRGRADVAVVVEAIIDQRGRLREPVILESDGELTMVYSVLDALRLWEFEPATLNGKPVDVYYVLTINFR